MVLSQKKFRFCEKKNFAKKKIREKKNFRYLKEIFKAKKCRKIARKKSGTFGVAPTKASEASLAPQASL